MRRMRRVRRKENGKIIINKVCFANEEKEENEDNEEY